MRCIEPMPGSVNLVLQPLIKTEVIRLNACKTPGFGVLVDGNGDAVAL